MSDHDKTLAERGHNEKTMAGGHHDDDHVDHDAHGGHDDHEHGVAGHEVDNMPSGRLFNLLFGLSALTLLASIGVVQLFYQQVDAIRDGRDAKLSFQLAEYRAEMEELKGGRVVEMTDDDEIPATEGGRGPVDARRNQMPLTEARKRVLEQPQLLKAGRPYRGWKTRDANAPKVVVPPGGPMPRNPMRPGPPVDGKVVPVPGGPGGIVQPPPGGMVQPGGVQPAPPAEAPAPSEGKAPAKGEGKAEGKAPAKREGKAEGKAPAKPEGKAAEGKANE
jgi:hypothetical protein